MVVHRKSEKSGEYCLVWGETTQVQGDISDLAMITPCQPPTPQEVAFTASFAGTNSCGGNAYHILLINNGDTKLESMDFTMEFGSGGAPILGPPTHMHLLWHLTANAYPVLTICHPGRTVMWTEK